MIKSSLIENVIAVTLLSPTRPSGSSSIARFEHGRSGFDAGAYQTVENGTYYFPA